MKRKLLFLLIVAASFPGTRNPAPLFAAGGVGTTAAPFLKIGMGARALGMGGAFSAIADDATAVYWNPAGLAAVSSDEVNFDFAKYFQDVNIGQAAYTRKVGAGQMGVGLTYLIVPSIEKRDTNDAVGVVPSQGTFNASDAALSVAYARKNAIPSLIDDVDGGAAFKVIRSAIGSKSAIAVAVDLGATVRAKNGMRFALGVQNLGTPMKFDKVSDPLPLSLRAGAAYEPVKALTLGLTLDQYLIDQKFYAAFGGEYWLRDALALRAGYRYGYDTIHLGAMTGISLGIGIKVNGLGLDYAYVPFGDLGDTHRFGFWMKF